MDLAFIMAIEGLMDPLQTFITDKAWFHFIGYMNFQNSWPRLQKTIIHQEMFCDQKEGVHCTLPGHWLMRRNFFSNTMPMDTCEYWMSFMPSWWDEHLDCFLQHDCVTYSTFWTSLGYLHILMKTKVSKGLWPASSADLSWDFYLWATLNKGFTVTLTHSSRWKWALTKVIIQERGT